MKYIKLMLPFLLTLAWSVFLNNPIVTADATLPALGPFLSPFTGFWHNAYLDDVKFGKINNQFVKNEATVYWDDRLVPHIFAQGEAEAFYVSGYSIASQRLWQMDMLSRSASGRLAEVLGGERLIQRDITQRRLGMMFGAENSLKGWQKDSLNYALLKAYCAGVNDYIHNLSPRDYPVEYKLMGFKPESWTPLKSASIVKYMAQSLCSREADLESTNTRNLLGDSLFNFLYPPYFKEQSPVIPADTKWSFAPLTKDTVTANQFTELRYLYQRENEVPPPGQGSNNWAVSGEKTQSGFPILCNDPHLRLTLPSIWFENHINTPTIDAYGVSVPGIPFILIGFNKNVAWGETNVGQDVADWYQINWTDSSHQSYLIDGEVRKVTTKIEEIKLKNKASIFDTVRYTDWGPVVTEKINDAHHGLAYHWIAHEIPDKFESATFLNLMKAKNYDDYYNALKNYSNPAQNFVFASNGGDIALTVNGNLPIKRIGQGLFVQDGATSANAWHGFIPYEHLPRVKNPPRGFVSSANQHSTDPSYPYYYNGDFENYRGRIINNALSGKNNLTPIDMMQLQNSTFSLKAQETLPLLLSLLDNTTLTSEQSEAVKVLRDWDFSYDSASIGALIFHTWFRSFYKMTLDELYSSKDSSNLLYPESFIIHNLLDPVNSKHKIFDVMSTPQTETAKDIANTSFLFTLNELKFNSKTAQSWGKYLNTKIPHMANLPGFSSEILLTGGTSDVLNAISNGSGPSWRMIVELSKDSPKAHVIFPGGQSGHPGSKYYANMINDWKTGSYQTAKFIGRSSIEGNSRVQSF